MYKRILSYFLAFAIVLTTVLIPTSFISTAVDTPKKQEEIIYTFDDVDAVENQPWEARNSSGGKAIAVSLESDSANVYGSTGKSLKVTYDTSKLQSGVAPSVGLKSGASITPKGDGLVFWIKSEKDTTVTIIAADAKYKDMKSPAIEVEKGAGTYYVDYADFTCSVTPDLSKMYLLQLKFYGTNEQNTIYVDNIGFFGVEVKDPEVFEPATGENLIYSFDDVTSVEELSWEARNSNDGKALSISLESDATNVYGGTGKSLKVTYDTSKRLNSVAPSVCLKSGASITPKGDGLVFWIKSEKDTSVTLIAADAGYKDMKSPAIEVKKGEGMYGVKFSDFSCSSTPNLSKMYLLQFRFYSTNEQNTIYVDNIGFFGAEAEDTVVIEPATGENLVFSFDDAASTDELPWETGNSNEGKAISISLESDVSNVYGETGKSLKIDYDTSQRQGETTPAVKMKKNEFITPKGDGLVFWIKSEKDTSVTLVAADAGYKDMKSPAIEVKKGEGMYSVKYSDFSCSSTPDLSRMYLLQFRFYNKNEQNTIYLDNIGFFEEPRIAFLPGATELISGFDTYDSIDDMNDEWKPYSEASTTLSIESNKENIYGNYNSSLKVSYDYTSSDSDVAGVTYFANITTKNDGFVFWIKSEEDTKIYLKAKDKNYKTVKTDDISISKGENTVTVMYDDFKASSGQADLSRLRNLSIINSGDNKSGTYYFDCFSFYFYAEPALHDSGFYECGIKAGNWKKNSTSVATFKWDTDSRHYHTGITGVKDTAALKLDYENLGTANTNSVYYDAILRANSTEPYIFGEDSILSFWIYTEQELCLEICYDDKDTDNNLLSSKRKSFIIPAGESIIRQPMSELVPEGKQSAYMQVMQLQFRLYKSDGTTETASGSVWIDAIGFYNANPETNTTAQTHSDKTFVWWDFDSDKTIADTDWSERFGGPNGLGVKATIDTDPQNAYGGEGRSLKLVCNPAEAQNNTPAIWLGDRRVTMYGKGISFWIKSENPTKLRIIGVDDNNKTVDAEKWIKKGENIVTILWDDFRVIGDSEAKANMSTAYQFQIRATTQIYNTLWIDSIGYYDIVDDGSNAYKSLYPPKSYDNWYDGVSVASQNFNKYKGNSDMDFCCDWYFSGSGWIELEDNNGNKMLRMDYDFSNGTSALFSEKNYTKIDPQGGISFWAKSSVERYYKLYLLIGAKVINIHVKIGPEGRYYKIPLSEFWVGSNINTSYEPDSNGTVTISRLRIYSDDSCNPPANNDAEQFSLWFDNLKFVDGANYKRATAVDYYENGVRLKADKSAFATGVTPKIDIVTTTPEEKMEYASKMGNSSKFINSFHIDAIDSYNISAIPQKAVELIFDVPDGVAPEKVSIYQLYIDGTLAKRNNTTITDDGKIKFDVYRLGNYVMGYSDILPDDNTQIGDDSDWFGDDSEWFGDDNTQTDNNSTQVGDDSTQTGDDSTQTDDNNAQTGDNSTQTNNDSAKTDDDSTQIGNNTYIVIAAVLFGIFVLVWVIIYCRKRKGSKKHEK